MALTTQFVRLVIQSSQYCIKSFPDISATPNYDQVEITTLCDEYHQYINGLKNFADDMEFTMNYDEAVFNALNIADYDSSATYGITDLCRHDGKIYQCVSVISTAEEWTPSHWATITASLYLCDRASDHSGKNGIFSVSPFDMSIRLSGGGVGDVLEMVLTIRPKGDITFQTVA